MDLRTLRYFIAVLEAGSLSRAAGSVYIAQPALSARIKRLEDELGAQLFDRSHTGVTPTPAGIQLYEDARRLLSDADGMRERIQRLPKGPEGSVTVALPFLLASLLSGPLLMRLRRTHPRILVFMLDDLSLSVRQAMMDRRADIGILVDTPAADGLHCRGLARENIYFCGHDAEGVAAPLLRPTRARGTSAPRRLPDIHFEDAIRLPLVLQSRRFAIRRQVEESALALQKPLEIAYEHDSTRVIRSLYLNGAGFTFTPACTLGTAPARSARWIAARVIRPELLRTYTVATPADKPLRDTVRIVMQALAGEARALITRGRWDARWLGKRWASASD